MLNAIVTFLAPLVLGILATTIIEAITGKTWGLLLRQRFVRLAKKRLRNFGSKGDLIRRGAEALYVIEFVPNGWQPGNITFKQAGPMDLLALLATADPSNLPVPAADLVAAIDAERTRLLDSPDGWWNGQTVGVDSIQTGRIGVREHPILTVTTFPSDHAAATVCSDLWAEHFDARDVQLPPDLDRPIPGMLHAVGLNATLVTDDNMLVLVHRSSRASSGRNGWHISVNEGMQECDQNDDDRLDPHLALVRGVREELGVKVPLASVRLHTAMYDLRRYQFGLLGHIDLADTGITAADIKVARQLGLAKDKFENSDIICVPWRFDEVVKKLNEPDWVAHGWMNLLYSAIASFAPRSDELYQLLGEGPHRRSPHVWQTGANAT